MEIVGKVARGEAEWVAHAPSRAVVGALAAERAQAAGSAPADPAAAGRGRPAPHARARALPDSLLAIIRKALALDPAARYRSVEALQADLLAYQTGFATGAENAGAWKQAALFVKRHKAVSIATAILLVVISAALANVFLSERRQRLTIERLLSTAPTFVAQAGTLIGDGKFDDALDKLAFAIELAPRLARAHLLRAHALQTLLRFPEALASFQTALSLARDPAEVADARANIDLCEKIHRENLGQSELLPKSLAELTEALSRQGRMAEALALAPAAGLAEKFRYEAMLTKLMALFKIPASESDQFRKRLRIEDSGLFALDLSSLPISDLSPLQGLPIRSLHLNLCDNVSDLSPLKGMPLDDLEIGKTKVSDLSPLRGMKLKRLMAYNTKITDLSQLAGMPLKELHLAGCVEVSDLRPLKGMPLEKLNFEATKVADIAILRGMPLRELALIGTKVRDVAMVAELTALEALTIPPDAINIDALRHLPNLKRIGYAYGQLTSPAEFWARYDAHK